MGECNFISAHIFYVIVIVGGAFITSLDNAYFLAVYTCKEI